MALNPKFTTLAVNTKAEAQGVLLDSGYLEIWDGTQPATADTAVGTQVNLATLGMNATAFAIPAVVGVSTANAITQDSSANATGTATWFRLYKAAGHTPGLDDGTRVMDGSVGTSGCNLNLNSVSISSGAAVSVTAFTLTESKG